MRFNGVLIDLGSIKEICAEHGIKDGWLLDTIIDRMDLDSVKFVEQTIETVLDEHAQSLETTLGEKSKA